MTKDGKKDKKQKKDTKLHSGEGDRGGSTHANESIGNFTADMMAQCIVKIKQVEAEAKADREDTFIKKQNI